MTDNKQISLGNNKSLKDDFQPSIIHVSFSKGVGIQMKDGLLGDTIRQARMDNKMTQEQLAEAINISPTHMKHIESEHRKPSVDVLFSLADVLSFSMDAMLMETQSTDHAKRVNEINLLMNKCTDEELDIFLAALRELMKQKR